MHTALITGGGGLLGSYVCRELITGDYDVDRAVVLDNFSTFVPAIRHEYLDYRKLRFAWNTENRVVFERGSTHHYGVMEAIVRKYKPAYIVHLAALPLAKIDNLNVEESQEGSVTSTLQMFQILGRAKAEGIVSPRKFLYTSSSMVYGDFETDPAPETHPTRPKEIYGTVKLAGEVVTRGLSLFYDIPHAIIRPSAVYGPTDMNRRVSQIFIEKAIRGQELSLHGGDDERLDFSYVKDVAKGIALALCSDVKNETFNITGGQARSLLDFAKALKVHFPELKYRVLPRDGFRPKRGTLEIGKARELLGYNPEYDLARGLAEYVEFVREYFRPDESVPPKGTGILDTWPGT